jgi:predicted DNA-binding transcriptional regulator AlpA
MTDYKSKRELLIQWLRDEVDHLRSTNPNSLLVTHYSDIAGLLEHDSKGHSGTVMFTMPAKTVMSAGGGRLSATMTREEAAKYVGVSVAFMNRARVVGDGPAYVKLGRRVVYNKADIDSWLASKRKRSTSGLVVEQFGSV